MFKAAIVLKNARTDKDLSFLEISKKLKIPAKYLEAIENEDYSCFPQEPYCSLMVKDYANFLGLEGDEIVKIFRRDYSQKNKEPSAKKMKISLTPQFTFKVGLICLIIFFVGYLFEEYLRFNRPPEVKVNWPEASSLQSNALEINGQTDPESTVRINQDLVIVDSKGFFLKQINLTPPKTVIRIEAKSSTGKTTVVEKVY
ncbi:MAG TPA: helix-turn-helix domain-containing protein [Candidatus Woesebacteria bacterium]|nr:helix-turn-helix domain-containing protein [Candidatus Woesebacteria bacterium]